MNKTRLLCPGISQARILEWAATSFSRESSQPRDRTLISCFVGATREARAAMEAQKKPGWARFKAACSAQMNAGLLSLAMGSRSAGRLPGALLPSDNTAVHQPRGRRCSITVPILQWRKTRSKAVVFNQCPRISQESLKG